MPKPACSGYPHIYKTRSGKWTSRGVHGVFDTAYAAALQRWKVMGAGTLPKPVHPDPAHRCVHDEGTDNHCTHRFTTSNLHTRLCDKHLKAFLQEYRNIQEVADRTRTKLNELEAKMVELNNTFATKWTDGSVRRTRDGIEYQVSGME